MTRIFRVLKVGSFAGDLQLFVDGMKRAKEGLMLLVRRPLHILALVTSAILPN
eukprot:SAG11_NODE_5089_length_1667_cov_1.667730_2_plen_53_part_00